MTTPLVSVITPVLNAAGTIRRTLASVAAQRHPRVEHLVIDGGSTDGTLDVVSSFSSPHALRWVSEPDSGMYAAVNRGMEMATGDVLAYLNADDLYLPWAAEVAAKALADGYDLVYGDLGVLTAGSPPTFRPQVYRAFDLNHYTHFEALAQPTTFWTRQLADRLGGFDETYRLIADCEYWLRAGASGARIRHVEEILALQLDHPETLRQRRRDELRAEFARLRRRYTEVAGPPRHEAVKAVATRARTRADRLRFVAAVRAGRAGRRDHPWPRFVSFLRDHGIGVSVAGLLWYLAPGRLRSSSASVLDAAALERALRHTLDEAPAARGPREGLT